MGSSYRPPPSSGKEGGKATPKDNPAKASKKLRLGDGKFFARVLIDHVPKDNVLELEVHMHDVVQLTGDPAPDGWLHARRGTVEGLVPADFVEILKDKDGDEDDDGGEE